MDSLQTKEGIAAVCGELVGTVAGAKVGEEITKSVASKVSNAIEKKLGKSVTDIKDIAFVENAKPGEGYSNFADWMSETERIRYIQYNEEKFFEEFSERAKIAGLNDSEILQSYDAMKNCNYDKMASYFDFSSPKDGAVFWSGNKEAAADYAKDIGGTIMEQTPGGKVFDDWRGLQGMYPEWDYGITPQVSIWEALSKRYAQGVSGIATYVHPDGYIGGIWKRIEKRVLDGNDILIEEIIIHG